MAKLGSNECGIPLFQQVGFLYRTTCFKHFQYEKGKPLVNLVDNMVKLGSLYRGSGMSLHSGTGRPGDVDTVRERLEFNQKVQEQRLLAEERRDWDRVSPDRGQLQVNTGACQNVLGIHHSHQCHNIKPNIFPLLCPELFWNYYKPSSNFNSSLTDCMEQGP